MRENELPIKKYKEVEALIPQQLKQPSDRDARRFC
jgi:hypothetical protein